MILGMSEEKRPVIIPVAAFCHDEKEYAMDFELPGVDKAHIELSISGQSVCVAGSRDDVEFAGCWTLAHEVDETKAEAKYENGLLRVRIPLKTPVEGTIVKIK
jgi:HSP20 family protein